MKSKDEVISTIEIALELEKGSLNIDTRMGSIEQETNRKINRNHRTIRFSW